jgi:hypothetical protein
VFISVVLVVAIAISETSRPGKRHFGLFGARRREALLRPPEEARGQRASLWRRRRALKTDSPSAFLAWASAAPAPQPPLPVHQKAPLREARAIPVATRENYVSAKRGSGATGEAALRRRVGPAPASRRDGSGAKPDFAPEQGQSRSGASRRGVAPERLRSGAVSVPLRSGGRRGSGAEGDAGGRASSGA